MGGRRSRVTLFFFVGLPTILNFRLVSQFDPILKVSEPKSCFVKAHQMIVPNLSTFRRSLEQLLYHHTLKTPLLPNSNPICWRPEVVSAVISGVENTGTEACKCAKFRGSSTVNSYDSWMDGQMNTVLVAIGDAPPNGVSPSKLGVALMAQFFKQWRSRIYDGMRPPPSLVVVRRSSITK